mmetsp:Transcript_73112/g.138167  ORF Transcript_73112/g.138167 Transcript_73112/m.138167 type:complete len:94 (+) Transcript_73112:362-643(+)
MIDLFDTPTPIPNTGHVNSEDAKESCAHSERYNNTNQQCQDTCTQYPNSLEEPPLCTPMKEFCYSAERLDGSRMLPLTCHVGQCNATVALIAA